ncbi:NADP-dependent oxidoreductase [Caulobacter sp. S45]|uniref:NADP-dependent oxidoreductase n=1 Tax=Caulobacter sp. S45 TaxID=1641861 RepID=UPI00131E3024|nr:NADP-dependent oxidoreductase [Caulobacter sp. S45]
MKAVRIHEFGGPEVLKLEELPQPEAGPGELLIEVQAASANPVDYKIRKGDYPAVKADQLPIVLGRDIAGIVQKLGIGVSDFVEGDEVFTMLPQDRGAFAEWVAAPANVCALKPASLDMVQAASVPLAALTAWQGLFDHGGLKAGQRVLIHGATGGVGPFAVQFARAKGAEVFATASSDGIEFVKGLGAHRAIDYRAERFEDIVHDVDLVYDLIGGETEDRSWQVLKRGGALISTVHEPDAEKAAKAGVQASRYTAQPNGEQLREIARMIDAGEVKVTLDKVFPLASAAEAETHLENDHVRGKVVLTVGAQHR